LTKRLLTALFALALLTGFAACGDDDDDDVDAAEESLEDTEDDAASEDSGGEESGDDASMDDETAEGSDAAEGASNPTDEFCADFNESEGGDTSVEEVQASLELLLAAQADAADQEVVDAMQLLADFTQYALDNDDGDGVITDAEVQAAAEQFPTFEDAIQVVATYCAG